MKDATVFVVIDISPHNSEDGYVFSIHRTHKSAEAQVKKFSWRLSTYRIEEHAVKS